MDEGVRNTVGTRLLQLTLKELFSWRFMQTDPNWCGLSSVRTGPNALRPLQSAYK